MNNLTNWHKTATLEQRKANFLKGQNTRRKNKAIVLEAITILTNQEKLLRLKIEELEKREEILLRMKTMQLISAKLTSEALLNKKQILESSHHWSITAGVYFLILNNEIIYIGQSLNPFIRIGMHREKKFERYAFIPCDPKNLNVIESLYIHFFQPKLNGHINGNEKNQKIAPLSFFEITQLQKEST